MKLARLLFFFVAIACLASCGRGVYEGVDVTVTQTTNQQKWYGCSLDLWRSYNIETHIYDDGVTHFIDNKGVKHDFPTQGIRVDYTAEPCWGYRSTP